jgi:tRNA-splicing ligase RtcB
MEKSDLKKLSDWLWEIPQSFRSDMKVPARIFASEEMLSAILADRSLEQLVNVATLPGIKKAALAMPDIHEGYGFPIGGIAATAYPDGLISPGGIGYDINCGVRLLFSSLTLAEAKPHLEKLADQLFGQIPSGVGRGGSLTLSPDELNQVLENGVSWLVKKGRASREDLASIESAGSLPEADPAAVSDLAKKRGRGQLGTMGAGNHFVEADVVEEIFEKTAAEAFGLFPNQVVLLVHSGSRGLGHQVATDYIAQLLKAAQKYSLSFPDRELAGVPLSSPEGQAYFSAMSAAANFAWANRQVMTETLRQIWQTIFGPGSELSLLYDVAHNIAKIEDHQIDGQKQKVLVHRKGATRAFPAHHPELPEKYRAVGQPALIPGTMGTASYVVVGTETGMKEAFGSVCHGAGRAMSRHEALRRTSGQAVKNQLLEKEISVRTHSLSGLAEEAPQAYKDVEDVVTVVEKAELAQKVARLRPVAVIKG